MNHRSPSPLTLMPNSVPLRASAVTMVAPRIPEAPSSVALHAAMPMLRRNESLAPMKVSARATSPSLEVATRGASIRTKSEVAAL